MNQSQRAGLFLTLAGATTIISTVVIGHGGFKADELYTILLIAGIVIGIVGGVLFINDSE